MAGAVLKRETRLEAEVAWQADLYERTHFPGVRVALPVRALTGALIVHGWSASRRLDGEEERDPAAVLEAGRRFHRPLRGVPRPSFLDERTDPWSIGDRVAWGELDWRDHAHDPAVARIAAALEPVRSGSQIVHGDLRGNVLSGPGLLPAVLDLSPYWRPRRFADAVVVGDELIWGGAQRSSLDLLGATAAAGQLVLRALLFRSVAGLLLGGADRDLFERAVDVALRATRTRSRASGVA